MTVLSFDSLPLWQGVQPKASGPILAPFELDLDPRGFFRQTTPPDIIAAVTAAYADESYNHITAPPGASAWADHFGELQANLCIKDVREGCSILEIGAGSLFLAERLFLQHSVKPANYVVIDPAMRPTDSSVEVISDYFPAEALAGRRFDMILAFNSLEHVPDPEAFLKGIHDSLTPNGRCYICIPDVKDMFIRKDLNVFLHEHISYFTEKSIEALANSVGLGIQSMTSSDDILWITAGKLQGEMANGVTQEPFLEDAARTVKESAMGKVAKIRAILDKGGRVAFHGATNGLNNFLHIFGLSNNPNIFVFDGDSAKLGQYLPTCPNAIRGSEDPTYREFPFIFVSAMTYYEEIRKFSVKYHGIKSETVVTLFDNN